MLADDAAPTEAEATSALSAFVLSVHANAESDAIINGSSSCLGGTTCNFAFLQGATVTISTQDKNLIDCARFTGWSGACAGQGTTCTLVMNSDLATSALYKFGGIPGCRPR